VAEANTAEGTTVDEHTVERSTAVATASESGTCCSPNLGLVLLSNPVRAWSGALARNSTS
jgi:hypothetical protein